MSPQEIKGNVVAFPAGSSGTGLRQSASIKGRRPGGDKVVVLGGTGFVGSSVARTLLDQGRDVTVVARRMPSSIDRLCGARVLQRDAADPTIYDEILDGASSVVYAVGCLFPSESNADPLADIHGSLTPLIRLLEALRRRPEVSMVFLSSGGTVYGNPRTMPVTEEHPTDPTTSYGILKLAAEKYIGMYRELYGLDARVLRVANAYGPGQLTGRGQGVVGAFLDKIVHGKPVTIFGTGRGLRDYIQVDDVARAVVASLTAGGAHTVNIGTGIGTSLLQIVEELERIAGRRIEIDFQPLRGFDVESIVLDVAPFRALTGHKPMGMADGLADAYAWTSAHARQPLLSAVGTTS
jgi:UDP-glucose 4-epimerase